MIPVLVFFFGIDPVTATTYSLFIVGLTACCGAFGQYRNNNIDYPKLLHFGIASVLTLFIVRRWLMKLIPDIIYQSDDLVLTKTWLMMLVFSLLMLTAGVKMIRQAKLKAQEGVEHPGRLLLQGVITGAITGFIGIGGGFIIVPSLVLFAGLPMKKAIGTSLVIITCNCVVGLLSNADQLKLLNLPFLFTFCALAIAGIITGTWFTKYIPDANLKPVFGWIIISMSTLIFMRIFLYQG